MKLNQPLAILTADLGYGDAGKGSIVDYLTRETQAHTIVRYNGGAQAAHNVITPDGRHHTFAQFGSGSFLPGTRTHLSRFMLLHPLAMLAEERHLQTLGVAQPFERVSIERDALVISPYQQTANRVKELARGSARHGSCGMGVGETMADSLEQASEALHAGDLLDRPVLRRKLRQIRDLKIAQLEAVFKTLPADQAADERQLLFDPDNAERIATLFEVFARQVKLVGPEYLGNLLRQPGCTIFEGAQGVLLDEWHGFYPYNTWSTLTWKNAQILLDEADFSNQVYRLGILRGYMTRHGAGPFVTEDPALSAAVQDHHNINNPWQQNFRVGYLDLLAYRYALQGIGNVDGLAITNLDRMQDLPQWKICQQYSFPQSSQELDAHFVVDNGQAVSIRANPNFSNLAWQEKLTQQLFNAQPDYFCMPKNLDQYLSRITQELGLPLAITSFGPRAQDKQAIDPFWLPHHATHRNAAPSIAASLYRISPGKQRLMDYPTR
jgi:adenylosuccinate synthase